MPVLQGADQYSFESNKQHPCMCLTPIWLPNECLCMRKSMLFSAGLVFSRNPDQSCNERLREVNARSNWHTWRHMTACRECLYFDLQWCILQKLWIAIAALHQQIIIGALYESTCCIYCSSLTITTAVVQEPWAWGSVKTCQYSLKRRFLPLMAQAEAVQKSQHACSQEDFGPAKSILRNIYV